jgi:hypothetical protein
MKTYSLYLPVFKQGDDFYTCLELNNNDPYKGFLDLAKQYESAAEICKTVANEIVKAKSTITAHGDTHSITIDAPEKAVKLLVQQEILVEENYEE